MTNHPDVEVRALEVGYRRTGIKVYSRIASTVSPSAVAEAFFQYAA